jgi:hypothetical protein
MKKRNIPGCAKMVRAIEEAHELSDRFPDLRDDDVIEMVRDIANMPMHFEDNIANRTILIAYDQGPSEAYRFYGALMGIKLG